MSAIAGILTFDGSAPATGVLEAITSRMSSAGPDGAGHWQRRAMALGHCMLRTAPEAVGETQPLSDETRGVTVVFDGRLDNREDLQRHLAAQGVLMRTQTDTELVLRAYQVWGDACPKHLLGDFAYAVWNEQRQKLLCAVDPMGAAQIHYVRTERLFAFASTEEALLALPGVCATPNEDRVACLFVPHLHPLDPTLSWIRQVKVMAPGQLLCATAAGRIELETYWRLEPGEELAIETQARAQAEFLAVFAEAVRCRLRAGSVGQMLSGGLDSAGIRATVARIAPGSSATGRAFHTYSAISDNADNCVETQCIRSMAVGAGARFLGIPSFQGIASVGDLVHEAWSQAHPVDNSILLPALMCMAASRNGDRVMLHGASGDVALDVPNRYIAYFMREGWWGKAWAECQQASANNLRLRGLPPGWLFLSNAWTAQAPLALKRIARRFRRTNLKRGLGIINPALARRLDIDDRLELRRQAAIVSPTPLSIREEYVQLVTGTNGMALGLAGFGRLGKRYGLDMRDPWSDKRVVEFLLRLPLHLKIDQGWTKHLVRTSFAADLAPQVRWRLGKEHLGWDFTVRLMKESECFVAETVQRELDRLADYIDIDVIRQHLRRYFEKPNDPQETELAYNLMVLILWLKRLQSSNAGYTQSQSFLISSAVGPQ